METENNEFIAADGVHTPRLVVGDRGAGWIVESWDHFKAAAGQWVVLVIVGFVIMLAIGAVPFLGIVNALFKPVWIAGLMLACHAQHCGKPVEIRHLFAGFGNKMPALLLCGLLQSVLGLIVIVVTMGPIVWQIIKALLPNLSLEYSDLAVAMERFQEIVQDLAKNNPTKLIEIVDLNALLIRLLVMLALLIPIYATFWFAPALIVLGNKSLLDALWLSFHGALKNSWPFLIYGLCGVLLCLLIPITLGLALLALVPMFYLSIYLSYRDIYLD